MTFFGSNQRPSGRDFSRPLRPGQRQGDEPAPETEAPSTPFQVPERSDALNVQPPSLRQAAAAPESCTNVIASGSRWKGNLNVDESVRIEGHASGEIQAKGTVHISESAVVDAKISAAFVVISGRFDGEVRCRERLELMPKSRVKGELVTKVLSVHEGAVIDGRVQMTSTEEPATRPAKTTEAKPAATVKPTPITANAALSES